MVIRILFFIFLGFALAGCTTGYKKKISQPPQAATYERTQYGYEDDWTADSHQKPSKKTYSEPVIQLSPKQIQRALKSAGFYQGPIDGKIGPKTKKAIIKFQEANGFKADGVVGKKTSAALNKYLSR
jgi:peptidoglycan hydrolase-like protein with peptidoglycan-binding domain